MGCVVFATRGYFQIVVTILVIQTAVIAQGLAAPFRYPSQRRLELFNEAMTLMWCHSMFMFTDFVPDPSIRYLMGYWLVTIVAVCMLVNLLWLYGDFPRQVFNFFNRKYKKLKAAFIKVKINSPEN